MSSVISQGKVTPSQLYGSQTVAPMSLDDRGRVQTAGYGFNRSVAAFVPLLIGEGPNGGGDEGAPLVTSGVPLEATDLSTLSATTYSAPGGTTNVGIIKASAGRLFGLSWFVAEDATLMIFNKATNPANGDTPVFRFLMDVLDAEPLSKRGQIGPELFPGNAGIYFSAGISWAWSSTSTTLTLLALGAAAQINAAYK